MKLVLFFVVFWVTGFAYAGRLTERISRRYAVKSTDVWYGGERTVFDFDGYDAWVVEPPAKKPIANDKPWTWTMQWRDAFVPRTGVPRLLEKGWHHVSIDTFTHRMDETGLAVSRRFQEFLVKELGFATKACLIGMSWGGFYSIRYANAYSENVASIYLDAPLLNFNGFGGDATKTPTAAAALIGPWAQVAPKDGNWSTDLRMPVNQVESIARAGIPILLLYGGQDQSVNPVLNCELFAKRFKLAGGKIEMLRRGSYGHHPHGCEESESTISEFFLGSGVRSQASAPLLISSDAAKQ